MESILNRENYYEMITPPPPEYNASQIIGGESHPQYSAHWSYQFNGIYRNNQIHYSKSTSYYEAETTNDNSDANRTRTVLTPTQVLGLEGEFAKSQYLTKDQKIIVANALQLTEKQVKIWFQNRRMKEKKKGQTTHDCLGRTYDDNIRSNIDAKTTAQNEQYTADDYKQIIDYLFGLSFDDLNKAVISVLDQFNAN